MRKDKKPAARSKMQAIVGYIGALALTVVFALYLSGRTGWFFFTAMVILPVISVLAAAVMKKHITVSAEISDDLLYKGSSTTLKITVKNSGYIPSPPLDILFSDSSALPCRISENKYTVSVMPRSEYTAEIPYTAKIWCCAKAGPKQLILSDYTGIFSFKMKNELSDCCFNVKIIPDIAEVSAAADMVKSVCDASSQNDDSEETKDTHALGFTGTAGFEHREYVPGDPIKRINWKLSGKRDKLMVRLDDQIVSSRHRIILDSRNSSGSAEYGEICGENMLGMLRTLIRSGFSADVWFYANGGWKFEEIENEDDVEQLRLSLAGYSFSENAPRIPSAEDTAQSGKSASAVIMYTPRFDRELAALVNIGKADSKTETAVTAAAASIEDGMQLSGIWLLAADGSAECIL